jgi:hypothetical protein
MANQKSRIAQKDKGGKTPPARREAFKTEKKPKPGKG